MQIMLNTISHILHLFWGFANFGLFILGLWINAIWIAPVSMLIFINFSCVRGVIIPIWAKLLYYYVVFLLEYFARIDCQITCHPQTYFFIQDFLNQTSFKNNNNYKTTILFTSNHRTRLDWLHLYILFSRFDNMLGSLVIIMKKFMSKLFWIGWVVQFIGIFIQRKWEIDQTFLLKYVKILSSKFISDKLILLFFTEGTDLWHTAIDSSNSFADKSKLPKYKYVLHPRTTGLVHVTKEIGKENLYCIMDCTLAYVDYIPNERINDIRLIGGRFVKKCLYHIECYTVQDIIKQYLNSLNLNIENDENINIPEYKVDSYLSNNYNYIPTNFDDVTNENENNSRQNEDIFGVNQQIFENAMKDWTQKTFHRREERLKEWYDNGTWIQDMKYKANITHIPYSQFAISLAVNFVLLVIFIFVWKNHQWYIWVSSIYLTILAWFNIIGSAIVAGNYDNVIKKEKSLSKVKHAP